MTAFEYLDRVWRELRNDYRDVGAVKGAIHGFHETGALTDIEAELWLRRVDTCPGHDDEGGRAWCAYCGDLPPMEEVRVR